MSTSRTILCAVALGTFTIAAADLIAGPVPIWLQATTWAVASAVFYCQLRAVYGRPE